MDMREQDNKEIEMPSTLGYNLPNRNSSSSKLSSPTLASTVVGDQRGDHDQPPQSRTIIFSDPSQNSHHHHLYPSSLPPNPLQLPQTNRPRRDPDPSPISPPIVTTSITNTPRTAPPPQTTGTTAVRYRECLKNHAASMGGHVTDGCGEFMPNGEEGTAESFKCAACECHRNFHRKEAEGDSQHVFNYHTSYPNKNNAHNRNIHSPQSHLQFPTPHSSLHQLHRLSSSHGVVGVATPSGGLIQPMMIGFGGGPAESSSEDLNMFQSNDGGQLLSVQPPLSSKKRFRTKFTQQQKDRMMEFAEKLGWKIQKQDEEEVHQFCSQVGVKRQVFKVWMHNSKQAMKKKQT
ncbi:zinc-finger homeodomain protein 6-like [Abrus precatorius]|uniref:Zinc-finger homeodomain protein 6-like n=1 Tax=Abrus precatorius TaxID=3816 RepID=A0A8B8KUR3_ABRPR|nr:zinc-finger homeodomain protein 6-like [Abrus precatorius]